VAKRWTQIEIKEIIFFLKERVAPVLWKYRRPIIITGTSALSLWLLIGFFIPLDTPDPACLQQIMEGEAPSSVWRWNPIVFGRMMGKRDAIEARSVERLKMGAPLAEAHAAAEELAWTNALLPKEGRIAALMVWSVYYGNASMRPRPLEGRGLLEAADRCGIFSARNVCLLNAMVASGALQAEQALQAYDAIDSNVLASYVLNPLRAVSGQLKSLRPPTMDGFAQEQAFSAFHLHPTDLAAGLVGAFKVQAPPEQERARLAQMAVVQTWLQGVSAGAQVLDAQDDPWLQRVKSQLAAVATAQGKEEADLETGLTEALMQASAGTMNRLARSEPSEYNRWKQTWEGWLLVDGDGSRLPRLDYQKALNQWEQSSTALPVGPVIEPPVLADGTLAPASGGLAILANQALGDLPQPVFTGLCAWSTLDSMGGLRPGRSWDDGDGVCLQSRLQAGSRLKAKLQPKPGGWALAVCLQTGEKRSVWVRKTFVGKHWIEAPQWMALQALRLAGMKLSPENQRTLSQPVMRTAADLNEFGALMGGQDLRYGRNQWFRRLYDHSPSLTLLTYATFDADSQGRDRWQLMADGLKAEPWHWLPRLSYTAHLRKQGHYIASLKELEPLLALDPGRLDALQEAGQCLAQSGLDGERIHLLDSALMITHHAPSVLVEAARAEDQLAWRWRGGGYGSTVDDFSGNFLQWSEQRSKAFALEASQKAPDYAPAYESLLIAGIVLRDPDEEEDQYVRASALADPLYRPTYAQRLRQLMPKWYGNSVKMLAFAHTWKPKIWNLAIEGQYELAYRGEHGAMQYRRQSRVWNEVRDDFVGHIRDCPWDLVAVKDFGEKASYAVHEDEGFKAMQTLWEKPELRGWAFQQQVVFLDAMAAADGRTADYYRYDGKETSWDQVEPDFYRAHPEWLPKKVEALKALCQSNPDNQEQWSALAAFAQRLGKKDLCALALKKLKGHYEDSDWDLSQAKAAEAWAH
jgi:hypothetical protein